MLKAIVHLLAVSTLLIAASAVAQVPPDVVRLRDGTFLRGTIVERSPTQVVIMLPTGETRTYPDADVEHAGPDAPQTESAPAAPPGAASPRVARLHVRSSQPELSLQRLQGTAAVPVWTGNAMSTMAIDQFGVMCNAPCDVEVPEGTYQLGIAQGTGTALRAGAPMDLRGDMTLNLSYDNRSFLRVMGWVTFGLGAVVGGGLIVGALAVSNSCGLWASSCNVALSVSMSVVGGVLFLGGAIAGLVLAFLQDSPVIDIIEPDGSIRF